MIGLLRAEVLKLRAARTTWWTLGAMLLLTAVSLTINTVNNVAKIGQIRMTSDPDIQQMSVDDLYWLAAGGWDNIFAASAADLYTSGQFAGLLVTMLAGIYVVSGEFTRGTIATAFLVEPRRHRVVAAKLAVVIAGSLILWAFTTLISVPAGINYLLSIINN
jgi:ABC-type transport system involved in multi-copper enzyme maturation permease subunit